MLGILRDFGGRTVLMIVLGLAWLLPPSLSHAQSANGGLRGSIIDADFSVPVSGVTVVIEGSGMAGMTKEDGSFFINDLPPGQYTVLASKDGFIRERRSSIIVTTGSVKELEMEMTAEVVELDEFVVTSAEVVDTVSTVGTISLQRELKTFTEVLGAQFISQTGASDAAKLLAKTTGINVAEGKFVVVRGLADRYNSVTLNGMRVPSSDPDRRAVALDLFPSSVIKDVRTSKTYLPDLPGESTGATINVKTKSVPDKDFAKFKFGTGYNSRATGNPDFLTNRGGGTGLFGTGSDRAQPEFMRDQRLPDLGSSGGGPEDTLEERLLRQRINSTLSTEMGTKEKAPPMDFSMEASLGHRTEFMGAPAGITAAVDYSKKYNYSDTDQLGRYAFGADGSVQNVLRFVGPADALRRTFPDIPLANAPWGQRVGQETMRAGMLVSLGIELDTDSEITATYFFNRVAEDRATLQYGFDPQGNPGTAKYRESLAYTERQLRTWQLAGDHLIDGMGADLRVTWGVSYNQSYQDEPDLRLILADYDTEASPPLYQVATGSTPFQRYWRRLDDESYNAKLDLESDLFGDDLPEGISAKIKFGGLLDYSDRNYRADSYEYRAGSTNSGFPNFLKPLQYPGQTWGDVFLTGNPPITVGGNLGENTFLFRQNELPETYQASQIISSGYMMFDVNLTPEVNVTFGARVESTDLNVQASPAWNYPEQELRFAGLTAAELADADLVNTLEAAFGGNLDARNDPRIQALSRASIQDVSLLPAFAATWDIKENQRVRMAVSQTLARPSFKEIAPVVFQNIETADIFVGNRNLQMSSITNYDVRWESFPAPGALIGVSGFAKTIENPIEFAQRGNVVQYVNVKEAVVYGFELEFQRDLSFIADELKPFSLGANYSYIKSVATRADPPPGSPQNVFGAQRRLQGQPDYIANFNLTYDNKETGWFAGAFLNVTGQQLFAVANLAYEPDVFQESITTLDLGLGYELWEGCKLSFRASNLMDVEIRRIYNNAAKNIHSSRRAGIGYTLSMNFEW